MARCRILKWRKTPSRAKAKDAVGPAASVSATLLLAISAQRDGDTARQSRKLSGVIRQMSAFGFAGSRRADGAKSSRPAKTLNRRHGLSMPSVSSVPSKRREEAATSTFYHPFFLCVPLCLCITNSHNLRMPRQFPDKRHLRLAAPAHPSALSATSALSGFDFNLFFSAPQRLCGEYSLVAASPRPVPLW